MGTDRLPLSHHDCRIAFRAACADVGAALRTHPIEAVDPAGEPLAVDIASVGAGEPARALIVMSGVHGVEAPIGSAVQCASLARVARNLPDDMAAVYVHVVNPWGLAHGRRQNEHNVDLNRNWGRGDRSPDPNDAYVEMHPLACPDGSTLPDVDEILAASAPVVAENGLDWVVDGITRGQYSHPDGLHFGGDDTEPSCRILEREVPALLGSGIERGLVLDLHTGIGEMGALTFLSSRPRGTAQTDFLDAAFGDVRAPGGDSGGSARPKYGQIATGLAERTGGDAMFAVTLEFGTADDLAQLTATYQEQWVHRHGDVSVPDHAAARERYRRCFTPDDPEWERACVRNGVDAVVRAAEAVALSAGPS